MRDFKSLDIQSTLLSYLENDSYKQGTIGLIKLFRIFNENKNIADVFFKVSALNSLYKTRVKDIELFKLSEHICRKANYENLDSLIRTGKSEAINLIKIGHGITTDINKEKTLYSFATKYCNTHEPDKYVIYDGKVVKFMFYFKEVIKNIIDHGNKNPPKLTQTRLRDSYLKEYDEFISLINKIKKELCEKLEVAKTNATIREFTNTLNIELNISNPDYLLLDRFMWLYAKENLDKKIVNPFQTR